ncbi:MAG: hypothetical protein QI223_08550 [Candidatus Korarchaeota archaeon]|nr:hypothetical protein [Candidatus Korarchaeota archaeon]
MRKFLGDRGLRDGRGLIESPDMRHLRSLIWALEEAADLDRVQRSIRLR